LHEKGKRERKRQDLFYPEWRFNRKNGVVRKRGKGGVR